jgi:hypothetical protein
MKSTLYAAAAALMLAVAAPAFASEQPDSGSLSGPVYSEQTLSENGTNGAPVFNTNPQAGSVIVSSPYLNDLSAQNGGN